MNRYRILDVPAPRPKTHHVLWLLAYFGGWLVLSTVLAAGACRACRGHAPAACATATAAAACSAAVQRLASGVKPR